MKHKVSSLLHSIGFCIDYPFCHFVCVILGKTPKPSGSLILKCPGLLLDFTCPRHLCVGTGMMGGPGHHYGGCELLQGITVQCQLDPPLVQCFAVIGRTPRMSS